MCYMQTRLSYTSLAISGYRIVTASNCHPNDASVPACVICFRHERGEMCPVVFGGGDVLLIHVI